MKIQSLALKYRPDAITDLVGQQSVVQQVQGMLRAKKLPSALLITGQSGCGKTTTSRIIAAAINCQNLGDDFRPCGECQPCKLGKDSPDYTEMNMSNTRGIDDVRALVQSAKSMPTLGNVRVFVLDEVHQLTGAAANAFLKALEEPPAKTIWILATTNPEKLLPTIVGRCTKLSLTAIDPIAMSKRLSTIGRKEGLDFKTMDQGQDILKTIVNLSGGKMRDAISILESAIYAVQSRKSVDVKTVLTNFLNTGEASFEQQAAELLVAILQLDIKEVIRISRTSESVRATLSKLRWLIQYHLDSAVGIKTYTPYSAMVFKSITKDKSIKLQLPYLIRIQQLLVDIECRFNSTSIDESVLFLSAVGSMIAEERR